VSEDIDLSFIDRPEIRQFIFYPRKDHYTEPSISNATNHFVEVAQGTYIGCRLYQAKANCPIILYFHGNGETVGDHDYIAPLYNQRGINLLVTDYRGYGISGGEPTFTNMIRDAHVIFKAVNEIIDRSGYSKHLFLMGRSLGSAPAVELASHYQKSLDGLIIESGFADIFRLLTFWGFRVDRAFMDKVRGLSNLGKIQSVHIPTLIIHAEYDHIIPLEEGKKLYHSAAAKDKRLLIIPNADHNNLMLTGMEQYFKAIESLVLEAGV